MGALIRDPSTESREANNKLLDEVESFIIAANGRWRNGRGYK